MQKSKAMEMLGSHATWFTDDADPLEQLAAKQNLISFRDYLNKSRTRKNSDFRRGYMSYLMNLLPTRRALTEHNYMRACNEMLSLDHYFDISQERIYYNLLSLLNEYLEE